MIKKILFLCLVCFGCLHADHTEPNDFVARPSPVPIEAVNEENVRAVLLTEVPDLLIDSFELISIGASNLVAEINEEWIFRFPRDKRTSSLARSIALFKREKWLLDYLGNTIRMPVPYYEYIGQRTLFVGYRKIPGTALDADEYGKLADEDREYVANQLAVFLSELHSSVSTEEAYAHGYEDYYIGLNIIEEEIESLGSTEVQNMVKEACACMRDNPPARERTVFQHGDLHGENLGYDPQSKMIQGVFDFSEAAVGDYAYDFGQLFTIHPELAYRVSRIYANLRAVESPFKLGAVDFILRRAISFVYWKQRAPENSLRHEYYLKLLEYFVPLWERIKEVSIEETPTSQAA